MPLSSEAMARQLAQMHQEHGGSYRLSIPAFKTLAGKARLRDAYVEQVDEALREGERENGYLLIDLREEEGFIVVARQSVFTSYDDLSSRELAA